MSCPPQAQYKTSNNMTLLQPAVQSIRETKVVLSVTEVCWHCINWYARGQLHQAAARALERMRCSHNTFDDLGHICLGLWQGELGLRRDGNTCHEMGFACLQHQTLLQES